MLLCSSLIYCNGNQPAFVHVPDRATLPRLQKAAHTRCAIAHFSTAGIARAARPARIPIIVSQLITELTVWKPQTELHSAEPIRKDDLGSSFPSRTSTTIGPDIFWPCGRSVAGSPFSTARTGLASGWCHCLVESPGAPRLPACRGDTQVRPRRAARRPGFGVHTERTMNSLGDLTVSCIRKHRMPGKTGVVSA
jgi:hypothetical protein